MVIVRVSPLALNAVDSLALLLKVKLVFPWGTFKDDVDIVRKPPPLSLSTVNTGGINSVISSILLAVMLVITISEPSNNIFLKSAM